MLTRRLDDVRISVLPTAVGIMTFVGFSPSTLIVHAANGRLAIAAISCMCL